MDTLTIDTFQKGPSQKRKGRRGLIQSLLISSCECGIPLMITDRVGETKDFLCPRCGLVKTVDVIPENAFIANDSKEKEDKDIKDLEVLNLKDLKI